jgi:hypothetical protein
MVILTLVMMIIPANIMADRITIPPHVLTAIVLAHILTLHPYIHPILKATLRIPVPVLRTSPNYLSSIRYPDIFFQLSL